MPKKTTALLCSLFFAVTFAFPFHTARAVMPPDFIYNIGSQLIQVFSVAAIFLSAVFGVSYKYIKVKLATIATKKIYLAVAIILVLAISAGATYFYKDYKQNQEFDNWIALSEQNEQALKPSVGIRRAPADQLEFGTAPAIETETPVNPNFIVQIENAPTDPVAEFIKKYYENIANGNLEDAYEMSKKSTSLNTFKSWYTNTTKVTLDNMVRIDDTKSSLELTLHEGPSYTKYGVLMTVNLENNIPKNIEKSEVRVLAEGKTPTDTTPAATPNKEGILREYYDFFEQNQSNPLSITNSKFKSIIDSGQTDYIVMDARENIEHNNGHFPNSTHIRYADLQAGRWIEIPNDKFVYVLCWSGIRGKEVAEFLRTKNIVASY
ncbi:MAG: rhodanese-like domain-containing protein, partial [Candidatus Peregrinibacteria bacterium]